jgi:CopA family copper-resistance protein
MINDQTPDLDGAMFEPPRSGSGGFVCGRREVMQGLGLIGAGVALGVPARAMAPSPTSIQTLAGDSFDLSVEMLDVNITGRSRMATVVNGSMPGPTLRFKEGAVVTARVTNRLREATSLHWHGLRLPADMDGVPGLSFRGIMPGETFVYRFPIRQSGTYWYHSHSGMQEQMGLFGALVLEPKAPPPYAFDREHVIMLSDWTDEDPMVVFANLKQQSDYYDLHQRTVGSLVAAAKHRGIKAALADWAMWGGMRMSPTDIMDVTGATYTFLINGQPPRANWTGLFKPGERVLLRFINGSSMSTFDVRIPGLFMNVVAADGGDVDSVLVEEFRIGVAETYDVVVEPAADHAYTIFAQAQDRTGYARGTLSPHPGLTAPIPLMDPRPTRSMSDMGMGAMAGMRMSGMDMAAMPGMADMPKAPSPAKAPIVVNADGVDARTLVGKSEVDNVAAVTRGRQDEAGDGLDGNGRRVLVYSDLAALNPDSDTRPPERDIEFHLTGNMRRWIWGFDGKRFSEAGPVHLKLGERVRFVLINDTMMEHPIHLHGFLFSLENGGSGPLPLKHTVNVKPAERVSFVFTADTPGHWAFHCHLMYHMESGMFRTVVVA